jgi:nitrous oxidase accessory protein
MKKRIVTILVIILLMFSSLVIVFPVEAVKISGNTFYVGGNGPGNYSKIQDAIDNASDGDTIYVYSGFYQEHLYIHKSIILKGEERNTTVIEAESSYTDLLYIAWDFVTISNFTIHKTSHYNPYGGLNDGISLHGTNVSIQNINFIGCGISYTYWYDMQHPFHNDVVNNYVNGKPLVYLEDKTDYIVDYPCGQVILVDCRNITISHQYITNLGIGITLYRSHNCSVYQNHIINATYGIVLSISNNNTISENILSFNSVGIRYTALSNNIFMKNTIESNDIGFYDSISSIMEVLFFSNDITITDNVLRNNRCVAEIYRTSNLSINYNDITNNDNSLIFLTCYVPSKISIKNNNFNSNKINVYILEQPEDISHISIDGNYWGRPRVIPKPIFGLIKYAPGILTNIPWIFIDWHPAKEPYDIP